MSEKWNFILPILFLIMISGNPTAASADLMNVPEEQLPDVQVNQPNNLNEAKAILTRSIASIQTSLNRNIKDVYVHSVQVIAALDVMEKFANSNLQQTSVKRAREFMQLVKFAAGNREAKMVNDMLPDVEQAVKDVLQAFA